MNFRVSGLMPDPFIALYGQSDAELARQGVQRCVVDHAPGFPDRIELRDMAVGETALLLNYTHQPADNAYRASHAIFVREGARRARSVVGELPEVLRIRPLSLRAFDAQDMMVDADLVDGACAPEVITRFFADLRVAYLHAHYAKRGCYAARIDRA